MSLPLNDTYLHVVYAGRGDAFYLEYTHTDSLGKLEHVLVPLDGGPLKATADSKHANSPYYKYYLAVGEHIWQERFKDHPNKNKFSPKAIINSHPHDDHLDGLMNLLESQWGETMEFTGPFIIPNEECCGLEKFRELANRLNFQASDGCSVPGINFYHPSPNSTEKKILSYNHLGSVNTGAPLQPAPVQMLKNRSKYKLPDKITVDTSSENLASILTDTDPDKTVGQGRMFFTGDNVGSQSGTMLIAKNSPFTRSSIMAACGTLSSRTHLTRSFSVLLKRPLYMPS